VACHPKSPSPGLGGFIGADRGTKPSDNLPPVDKVLPTEPFSLEKLRAADADVRFKGARIITQKMPLEKMDAHLIVMAPETRWRKCWGRRTAKRR
jgi:uncharacterized protein involved in outer membrane biogenesis